MTWSEHPLYVYAEQRVDVVIVASNTRLGTLRMLGPHHYEHPHTRLAQESDWNQEVRLSGALLFPSRLSRTRAYLLSTNWTIDVLVRYAFTTGAFYAERCRYMLSRR